MLALAACTPASAPRPAAQVKVMAPTHVTYQISDGSMTVLEVPVSSLGRTTESQTCFLWRDASGSSLQCPNDRRSYTIDPPEN